MLCLMNQSFWMNRFNESLIQTLTCCQLLAIFAFNWKVLHFFYNISYFYISNVISKTWILSFNIEIWNIYKYIFISFRGEERNYFITYRVQQTTEAQVKWQCRCNCYSKADPASYKYVIPKETHDATQKPL